MGEAIKNEDEEVLVPVGPGAEGLDGSEAAKDAEEPKDDKRLAAGEDEADGEEEKESPTGRKRETARERRERAKAARTRDRLEVNFLLKRNEDLEKRVMSMEGRTAQTEHAAIDQRITNIHQQLANADRVLVEALRKPNGDGADEFVEAQKIRDQLRDQLSHLSSTKQAHERQASAQKREPAQEARPDPRVLQNARDWASRHEWFDFNGSDEQSVVVRAIDEALAGEGFDPSSPDYWEELTARVKRRLPERFKGARVRADDEDDDTEEEAKPRSKTGPRFFSGGRERPLRKGEVYVSSERKEAMKQYGVWDDPVARNRMLKKYAQWDAEFSASSNRS